MIVYFIFTLVILLIQALLLVEGYRHCVFTRRKYRPKACKNQPPAAIICPCKGLDNTFDRNIHSLFEQAYDRYEVFFVVQSQEDPAYPRLKKIIQQRQNAGGRVTAHILIAGAAETCVQKVHNLITACDALPEAIQVMAFVDSDTCLKSHFLDSLVYPLFRRTVGATTGYRWFVPTDQRLSSQMLSAMNAAVASLLGPHRWNSAWGGAMAVRRDTYHAIGLRQAWQNACSDDFLLTRQVKKARLNVEFVPACFVASYEQMSWRELFSFARRQFIITRVCMFRLWLLALFGWGHSVLAFWIGLAVTGTLLLRHSWQAPYAAVLPAALMLAFMTRAAARQSLIRKILPEDKKKLALPALIDIFLGPLVGSYALVCVLAAAGTRTIVWRQIKYHLKDINHTQILPCRTCRTSRTDGNSNP